MSVMRQMVAERLEKSTAFSGQILAVLDEEAEAVEDRMAYWQEAWVAVIEMWPSDLLMELELKREFQQLLVELGTPNADRVFANFALQSLHTSGLAYWQDLVEWAKETSVVIPEERYLGRSVHVVVDRPKGFNHRSIVYPINYGFLPGTVAGDGEELDAYILGPDEPIGSFDGICIAVIHRWDDNENKLVVSSPSLTYTASSISAAVDFQEQYFKTEIIMSEPQGQKNPKEVKK